jgi:hypothetical protein
MSKILKPLALSTCLLVAVQAQANKGAEYHPAEHHKHHHRNYYVVEVGGFVSSAGEDQFIAIDGLIGNDYTIDSKTDVKPLFGFGYMWNTVHNKRFDLDVGVNAFYLWPARVKGDVVQELMFENLSNQYNIGNLPIYAQAKANIKDDSHRYALTLDLGVGPNVMFLSDYRETSRDGGVTLPDDPFKNTTNVTFTANAGIGVKFYNAGGSPALELGYRFFYLGDSEFDTKNDQIAHGLKTGTVYANALVFTIAI